MASTVTIFIGSNGQYYFNLKAKNGERVLNSEGYLFKSSCENDSESVITEKELIKMKTKTESLVFQSDSKYDRIL